MLIHKHIRKISRSPWLAVLVWAGVIFFFSGIPNPYRSLPDSWNRPPAAIPAASDNELLGRILHTAEYAVLAALTLRALAGHRPDRQKPALPLHPLQNKSRARMFNKLGGESNRNPGSYLNNGCTIFIYPD